VAVQYQVFPYSADFEKVFTLLWTQDPLLKLQAGHGILYQHLRGCRPGTGVFNGFHALEDIRDTMVWLKTQRWWNGVLFGTGYSAMGALSYLALREDVPFTAQSIAIAGADESHFIYQNGALRSQLVNGMLGFVGQPSYNETYLRHEAPNDAFWADTTIEGHYGRVKWPAVHSAGWFDVFQKDQLTVYRGYRDLGHPSVRDLQFLVVSPGGHCFNGGAVVWPTKVTNLLTLLTAALQDLLFGVLRDAGTPEKFALRLALLRLITRPLPRVFWFVMGPGLPGTQGNWISAADDFPSPTPTPLYLAAGRRLADTPPAARRAETYTYDPRDPVPTWGGCNMGTPPGFDLSVAVPCGPWDQHTIHQNRSDILEFTAETLRHPLAITGSVRAVLFASTDGVDTDFTAKLVDVFPNGTRLLVLDGIQRLRWRDPAAGPQPAVPGRVYRLEIDLWGTSYVFPSGHRVGLDISSSNFPRFDANPNTGRSLMESAATPEARVATNTIHFGPEWGSHVLLPVVPTVAVRPLGPGALADVLRHLARHTDARDA